MRNIIPIFVAIGLIVAFLGVSSNENLSNLRYGENILNENISQIIMVWNVTWSPLPSGGMIFTKGNSEFDVDVGLRGEPYKYSLMIKNRGDVLVWKQVIPREWSAVSIEDYATMKVDFLTDTISYTDKVGESIISYDFPEGNTTRIYINTIGDAPLKYVKYG